MNFIQLLLVVIQLFNINPISIDRLCLSPQKNRWLIKLTSSRPSCTRSKYGVEADSRCERFKQGQRRRNLSTCLTLLNEAVDILTSQGTPTDHPAHQSVGSAQVSGSSERGELREMARLFPFYSQGASAGKVRSPPLFKRFRLSASSRGPKKGRNWNQKKRGLARLFVSLNWISQDQLIVPSREDKATLKEAGLYEKK